MVLALATGCGQEEPVEEIPTEEEAEEPAAPSDPYITGGSISPFYVDPSTITEDETTEDPDSETEANVETSTEEAEPEDEIVPLDYDLYVATYGDDKNDGTIDNPFATIQRALDSVTPGHTVFIMSGIYKGANKFTSSGTSSAPIRVTCMPNARVTVSLGYGEEGAIFDINGQSYIEIIDLIIGNCSANWVYGVYMSHDANNILIEENEFINIIAPGNCGAYAIIMLGDGNTEESAIRDVYVYDNEIHQIYTGYGHGIAVSGNVDNITLDGNHVYDVNNIGVVLYGGGRNSTADHLDQPRNCTVVGNEIHHCVGQYDHESCSALYIDGARDSVVNDNYVYENAVGIEIGSENYNYDYPTKNIVVSNNTVHDNHDAGISIGGLNELYSGVVYNCEISNNILYNNGYKVNDGANGEIHFEKCNGVLVKDNIVRNHDYLKYPVIGCGKTSEHVKNVTFENNLYAYDKPEKMIFRFQGNIYNGLDAWNEFTGGSDINAASSTK